MREELPRGTPVIVMPVKRRAEREERTDSFTLGYNAGANDARSERTLALVFMLVLGIAIGAGFVYGVMS